MSDLVVANPISCFNEVNEKRFEKGGLQIVLQRHIHQTETCSNRKLADQVVTQTET
jgi:hypothetical protein